MKELIYPLLAAENEAKWLREEKLGARLEDLKAIQHQQRPEFADHKNKPSKPQSPKSKKWSGATHLSTPSTPSTN